MCVLDAFDHQHLASVSADRRRGQMAILRTLGDQLSPIPVEEAKPEAVARFLADRVEEGYSPSTVRKWRAMILAFYGWAWRAGHISGDTLLKLREVRQPNGSCTRAQPEPNRPG